MTPKEKAKELIEKYQKLDIEIGGQYDGYLIIKIHDAKECALITVDEILSNFGALTAGATFYTSSSAVEFYYEVKQEIEKL